MGIHNPDSSGGGGSSDHSALTNLDFASSGHTGFASETDLDLRAHANVGICVETPINAEDVAFDTTTRILTVTPPLGTFHFFVDGSGEIHRFEKGTVTFPAMTDTTGAWYFHFDHDGNAVTTQTPWTSFGNIVSIARITWNATKTGDEKLITFWLETHPNDISAVDHLWKHNQGSQYVRGGDIATNFIASGSPNADGRNTCVGVSSCTVIDDNLEHIVTNDSTPTTYWQQDLGMTTPASLTSTNGGLFPIRYRGVGGLPELVTATRYPFLWDVTTNRPQYPNTTTGVLQTVTSTDFFVVFLYQVQDPRIGQTIRSTMYYGELTTLNNAQAITWESIQAQDTGANDKEIRPLYRLIYEYRSSYSASCKYSALRSVTDIRKTIVAQITAPAGTIPATQVTNIPAGGIIATNAQDAINELDSEKLTIGGDTKGANLVLGTNDDFNTIIEANDLPVITVTPSRYVGINNDSPQANLDMTAVGTNGALIRLRCESTAFEALQFFQSATVKGLIGYYGNTYGAVPAYAGAIVSITVEALIGRFVWVTNNAATAVRMTLENDGTLDVTNSIKSAGDSTLTSATASAIGTNYKNSTTGTASTDGSFVGIAANGDMEVRQKENLQIRVFTNNTEQLSINALGQILIGSVASSVGADDNLIKPSLSSGYLNLKGGSGKAKISIGDDALTICSGGTTGVEIRTGALNSTNNGSVRLFVESTGNVGIGTSFPKAKLDVSGGVKIGNDASAAVSTNVGTMRYRTSGNNSYMDMCMQTGASTYEWVNIKTNSW